MGSEEHTYAAVLDKLLSKEQLPDVLAAKDPSEGLLCPPCKDALKDLYRLQKELKTVKNIVIRTFKLSDGGPESSVDSESSAIPLSEQTELDNSRQNSVTELNQDVGTKKNRRSKKRIELKKDKDKKLIRTSSTETDMTETGGHTKKRKEKKKKTIPPQKKKKKKKKK